MTFSTKYHFTDDKSQSIAYYATAIACITMENIFFLIPLTQIHLDFLLLPNLIPKSKSVSFFIFSVKKAFFKYRNSVSAQFPMR